MQLLVPRPGSLLLPQNPPTARFQTKRVEPVMLHRCQIDAPAGNHRGRVAGRQFPPPDEVLPFAEFRRQSSALIDSSPVGPPKPVPLPPYTATKEYDQADDSHASSSHKCGS